MVTAPCSCAILFTGRTLLELNFVLVDNYYRVKSLIPEIIVILFIK